MEDKEQRLLRQFIYDYEEVLARNGDWEWTFPAEWTDEEKTVFVREYHECNGEPERFDPSLICLPEYAVLTTLRRKLERYLEEQNSKRPLPRMVFSIPPKQKAKIKFVVVGYVGDKTVYINKTREEALRLYIEANAYSLRGIRTEQIPVQEFEEADSFNVHDIYLPEDNPEYNEATSSEDPEDLEFTSSEDHEENDSNENNEDPSSSEE